MTRLTAASKKTWAKSRGQRGASFVEMALLIALIAVTGFASVNALSETVQRPIAEAGASIDNGGGSVSPRPDDGTDTPPPGFNE
jgi:hypothetical protein